MSQIIYANQNKKDENQIKKWATRAAIVATAGFLIINNLQVKVQIGNDVLASKLPTEQAIAKKVVQQLPIAIPVARSVKLKGDGFGIAASDVQEYRKRFEHVVKNEMRRYGIPASVLMATALLNSHGGASQLSIDGNNHFALESDGKWKGSTLQIAGKSYRKYPTAWLGFRDNSKFLAANMDATLIDADYKLWAKWLEAKGYGQQDDFANLLIRTIEENRLEGLDG